MARKPVTKGSARGGAKKAASRTKPREWADVLALPLQEQHALVGSGFPYALLERLQEALSLTLSELADLVGIQSRTLSRRRGAGRLDPAESDRVLRAARVLDRAQLLFDGDALKARTWLRAANRALGGKAPLELARTEVGAREVEALIGRLEHGVLT